jgi:predicted component of type VI protein secretion system
MKRIIATLAILALALPAWGELYKWVDENGNVHYSDQPPPPNAKQQKAIQPKVSPQSAPPPAAAPEGQSAAPAAKAKTAAELDMEFRKRRTEAAEAEAKRQHEAEAAAEKQRNCEQAKARVAVLQTGGRITKASSTGEQVYLGDAEIASELIEARKVADSWCK